jgi:hypothetical protein
MAGNSLQFQLNCRLEMTGWDDVLLGSAFACKTQDLNISSPQTRQITKVFPERSDKTVNAFLVLDQNCELFPSGIDNFFKNLEGIAVQRSNLQKITKNDLKPFGDLLSISLFGNKLQYIEHELFRYNPKLAQVSLFQNQLQHIFPTAFDLGHLKVLYLNSNPCIDQDALSPTKIEELKCDLVTKCKTTESMKDFAELEAEKLKLEDANVKLEWNIAALNKNFVAVKRDSVRFRDGYER